jgi:hypothetical protein
MYLLVINSIWEFLGGAIMVVFMFYFFYMFMAFLSKISKTGISYRGKAAIYSNDFDDNIKFWKKNANKLLSKINDYKKDHSMSTEKKMKLLSDLNQMYKNGEISVSDYESLKKSILNN